MELKKIIFSQSQFFSSRWVNIHCDQGERGQGTAAEVLMNFRHLFYLLKNEAIGLLAGKLGKKKSY